MAFANCLGTVPWPELYDLGLQRIKMTQLGTLERRQFHQLDFSGWPGWGLVTGDRRSPESVGLAWTQSGDAYGGRPDVKMGTDISQGLWGAVRHRVGCLHPCSSSIPATVK